MSAAQLNTDELATLSRMIDEGKTVNEMAIEMDRDVAIIKSAIRDLSTNDGVGEGE